MTQPVFKIIEIALALLIPLGIGLIAYGTVTAQVHVNTERTYENRNRISSLETKQAGYDSDMRWIKDTLLEIKEELKTR